ncbi:hypothetical protein G6M70_20245 [Agrobacterium tumefaciens]|uniref:hypothetical protein n=1 Tax=Agrobacterium tumefaciens TaxID=358 RepID=UPI0015731851|nr:hypothetical protein [Agrobacterium tumefaciens]NSY99696.1 hypothetical protein [Agrobacterium tumefaciens]NSZ40660.1 hypothetical protein [Agrobacterium tumefaciens]NTB22456.1 hypothetical protein [Agrobacterium tumefaciens]NTB27385.1 hypothetical protein [Agrobacterium tumefaciens]NTB36064.1 hypothetical protein [Agrobacterium tumefaciens]
MKSLETRFSADPRPPHSEIFFLSRDFLPVKQETERLFRSMKIQVIENAYENMRSGSEMVKKKVFFTGDVSGAVCVICGEKFTVGPRPRQVCSEACKRERSLRYGANYRQENRDLRAKIHAMFGGRAPTQAEILTLIRSRKAQSDDGSR